MTDDVFAHSQQQKLLHYQILTTEAFCSWRRERGDRIPLAELDFDLAGSLLDGLNLDEPGVAMQAEHMVTGPGEQFYTKPGLCMT